MPDHQGHAVAYLPFFKSEVTEIKQAIGGNFLDGHIADAGAEDHHALVRRGAEQEEAVFCRRG